MISQGAPDRDTVIALLDEAVRTEARAEPPPDGEQGGIGRQRPPRDARLATAGKLRDGHMHDLPPIAVDPFKPAERLLHLRHLVAGEGRQARRFLLTLVADDAQLDRRQPGERVDLAIERRD